MIVAFPGLFSYLFCPAKGKKCRKCGHLGHFEVRFKSKAHKGQQKSSLRHTESKQVRKVSLKPWKTIMLSLSVM